MSECPLTERQVEVVSMLADGKVRKFVAGRYGVSEASICMQIRDACDRASVIRKDAALVAKSIREGWIE